MTFYDWFFAGFIVLLVGAWVFSYTPFVQRWPVQTIAWQSGIGVPAALEPQLRVRVTRKWYLERLWPNARKRSDAERADRDAEQSVESQRSYS